MRMGRAYDVGTTLTRCRWATTERVTAVRKASLTGGINHESGRWCMSRQVRNRVTAVVLGGFLLGTAIATTGTANAGQIEARSRQVVFAGGGMFGFSCRSTPSVESMTVEAASTVRVVNRTGRGAKLMLNGASRGTVADDTVTEVVFRRGTTAVTLESDCASADESTPVVVTTTPPSTSPTPGDGSELPDGGSGGEPTSPSGSETPPTSGSQDPAPTQSQNSPTAGTKPPVSRPSTPGSVVVTQPAAPSMPLGGTTADHKTQTVPGTAGSNVPAYSEMSLGDDRAVLDDVPLMDVPLTTTEAAPAQQAAPVRDIAAAEPVAAMAPIPDSPPIGLLAIVAAVCVLGVGTGAIRAFVSQRAYRSTVA
jgi:hypothetical protein